MLTTKLWKGLLVLTAVTFLFACASKGDNQDQEISSDVEIEDTDEISAPPAKTPAELDAERRAAEMQANREARRDRVIYFDYDESTLSFDARSIIEAHAWFLSQNSNIVVTVEGHCDERGTPEYNLALGERRAKAIAQHLMLNGVSSAQIKTVSHGEEKPADSGHDESAWSQNRRGVLDYVE